MVVGGEADCDPMKIYPYIMFICQLDMSIRRRALFDTNSYTSF